MISSALISGALPSPRTSIQEHTCNRCIFSKSSSIVKKKKAMQVLYVRSAFTSKDAAPYRS